MADSDEIKKRYFTIGEVAARFGVKTSLIRFWETEFPQLAPRKNRKGNRTFNEKDIEVLEKIYYLVKVRKYTLAGAREKLKQNPKDLEYEQKTRDTLLRVRAFLQELKGHL